MASIPLVLSTDEQQISHREIRFLSWRLCDVSGKFSIAQNYLARNAFQSLRQNIPITIEGISVEIQMSQPPSTDLSTTAHFISHHSTPLLFNNKNKTQSLKQQNYRRVKCCYCFIILPFFLILFCLFVWSFFLCFWLADVLVLLMGGAILFT